MVFNKSNDLFPVNKDKIFLASCAIAPLYRPAAEAALQVLSSQSSLGHLFFNKHNSVTRLKKAAAALLKTSAENVSFMKNTTEGLGLVAAGYPWQAGDEVIISDIEYPANHYAWTLAEKKGVCLKQIKSNPEDHSWDLKALTDLITKKTRVVALSHVQFTSGFCLDLEHIAAIAQEQSIDLIIDAAQSLGAIPVDVSGLSVACVAASGWKWLLGPAGTGVLYTRPDFRAKLQIVLAGAESMLQGQDYLDHTWNPHVSARMFEYSTSPFAMAEALSVAIEEVALRYSPEACLKEITDLQDVFLEHSAIARQSYLPFFKKLRSPILALRLPEPGKIAAELQKEGIIVTSRSSFLRIAPHIFNSREQMQAVAKKLDNLQPLLI